MPCLGDGRAANNALSKHHKVLCSHFLLCSGGFLMTMINHPEERSLDEAQAQAPYTHPFRGSFA